MASNVFDVDAYLSSLKDKYNIPDEELSVAVTEIKRGFKRQDDYSRSMDEARRVAQQAAEAKQRAIEEYTKNRQWYEANEAALHEAARMREAGYRESEIDVEALRNQFVSREELEQLQRTAAQGIQGTVEVATFLTDKSVEYKDRYGKRFQTKDFQKFIEDPANQGKFYNLDNAYSAFVAEDEKSYQEQERRRIEDEIRADERQKIMSTHNIPSVDGTSANQSMFYKLRDSQPAQEGELSREEKRARIAKTYIESGKK